MDLIYRYFFLAIWIAWMTCWLVAAFGTKRTVRRESIGLRLVYMGPILAGVILFVGFHSAMRPLMAQIYPHSVFVFWAGAAVTLCGFAFTIWARATLGRNWSGRVTLKENHELIQSGPYALVRHPIYTGILAMLLGSAIAVGQWRMFIFFALLLLSFWLKLRIEEKWMIEHFGPTYEAYRKRVAMLIPWV
jgi:protein-S-isoprenylcysteine O-methyltransferase Ste14